MKYIRTKDGRILKIVKDEDFDDEEKAKIPNDCTMVYASNMFGCSIISNKNIIKQADTIEELCDEFRVRDNDNYSTYEIDIGCRNLKELFEELTIQNQTLFGAIWTEQGLKYVATMNERGDWKLL